MSGPSTSITSFRSITMLCGKILTIFCGIFLTFSMNDETFYKILSVAKNTIMDLNNVMSGHSGSNP